MEAGLVCQQVLVLPFHHPGVADTAQVAHQGGQAQRLLRAEEGVEGAAVPGGEEVPQRAVQREHGGEGAAAAHPAAAVHQGRAPALVARVDGRHEAGELRHVVHHAVVGPQLEMHVPHILRNSCKWKKCVKLTPWPIQPSSYLTIPLAPAP